MTHQAFLKKRTQINQLISSTIFFFVLLFSCSNEAQNLDSKNDLGVFHFEEEVIDYGNIAQNDNGLRTFKFTNRGRAPIVISKVKTTCGCTVPTYPKQAILPGETASIDIKYATNRVGSFSKTITVISNADEPQKKLRIKGNVIAKPKSSIN
ncbi:DUF1573 domain-containing protein [Psychroserpens sp. S379A]|uniref:DUF1573 domain-containing protein n=1 Tax=Psychroserpens sp. S379A TaxID=3415137 RepID=UPI003C7C00BF